VTVRSPAIGVLAALGVVSAVPALAQPSQRVTISVNGGYQPTKHPFTDRLTFDVNRETGTTTARYPGDAGLVVDAGVAVGLWRQFGVGVAVSRLALDETSSTETDIPHPFFFNTPRHVTADVNGLRRTELGVHADVIYRGPISRTIAVALFAGPSFLRVERDTITAIEYDESFPFDVATFRRGATRRGNASGVTFNAGADLSWMLSRHVGIGGMARFAEATVDLDLGESRTERVSVGGFTAGLGVRIAF
jgi:hypothetical protein